MSALIGAAVLDSGAILSEKNCACPSASLTNIRVEEHCHESGPRSQLPQRFCRRLNRENPNTIDDPRCASAALCSPSASTKRRTPAKIRGCEAGRRRKQTEA